MLSGPAGSGKTTLVQRLVAEFPQVLMSISCTTRQPRNGEIEGKDYFFIGEEEFQKRVQTGEFLEHIRLYDTSYYGSSRKWVSEQLATGKHVFLVIDTQGARALRAVLPHVSIFIAPPSLEELQRRLEARKTESPEKVHRRLEWAKTEMDARSEYDFVVVNDELNTAYEVLRGIVIAETHRSRWMINRS